MFPVFKAHLSILLWSELIRAYSYRHSYSEWKSSVRPNETTGAILVTVKVLAWYN